MMRGLLERFRLWRLHRELNRSARILSGRLQALEVSTERSRKRLEDAVERARRDDGLRQLALQTLQQDVRNLENHQKIYEGELQSLREERKVLVDVTIPGLVQSNELVLQRLRAMTNQEIQSQLVGKEAAS